MYTAPGLGPPVQKKIKKLMVRSELWGSCASDCPVREDTRELEQGSVFKTHQLQGNTVVSLV